MIRASIQCQATHENCRHITFMISSGYNFLIGRYIITCLSADHNVFPLLQDPTDANIAIHMKNIYDTLAAIQSRLTSVDERLSQIEADIYNIGMTTPQPGPSFSSPDVTLSSLPADCSEINLQAAVENTLPLQSLDWSPDMRTMSVTTPKQSSKRSITSSNSSVSLLVSHLPPEVANRVKKIKRTDRKTYTRGCMDALFTTKEMATSNMDGKRNKDKLDEKRVDLVKRKQTSAYNYLIFFFHSFISCFLFIYFFHFESLF